MVTTSTGAPLVRATTAFTCCAIGAPGFRSCGRVRLAPPPTGPDGASGPYSRRRGPGTCPAAVEPPRIGVAEDQRVDLSYASSCRGGGGGWVGCGLPAFDAMVAIGWFALNAGHWQIGGGVPTMAAPSPSGTIAWHRARRSTRPPTRPSADGRPPIDPGSVRRRGDGRARLPRSSWPGSSACSWVRPPTRRRPPPRGSRARPASRARGSPWSWTSVPWPAGSWSVARPERSRRALRPSARRGSPWASRAGPAWSAPSTDVRARATRSAGRPVATGPTGRRPGAARGTSAAPGARRGRWPSTRWRAGAGRATSTRRHPQATRPRPLP